MRFSTGFMRETCARKTNIEYAKRHLEYIFCEACSRSLSTDLSSNVSSIVLRVLTYSGATANGVRANGGCKK